jgi:hypothetical protein
MLNLPRGSRQCRYQINKLERHIYALNNRRFTLTPAVYATALKNQSILFRQDSGIFLSYL